SLPGDLMGLLAALTPSQPPGAGGGLLAAVLAALGLAVLGPLRIVLARLGRAWATRFLPSAGLRKSALALWLTGTGVLTPFLAGLLFREALFALVPRAPVTEGLAWAV